MKLKPKHFLISLLLTVSYANANQMPETSNLVKAGDKYVTLLGHQTSLNQPAPDFKVVDKDFAPVTLSDFKGKNVLLSIVPSIDTGVCSLQTKRFNEEVANVGDNTVILTVSNDLPFAQKRYCKTENVNQIQVLSDAVWRDLGEKYGLLIKDMGLLTRSIFIVNANGTLVYKEIVENISSHPDYKAALNALKALPALESGDKPAS